MGQTYYHVVKALGSSVLKFCSKPFILHRDRADLEGGYLLAANHFSIFDVAISIAHTPRMVEWISIVEIFQNPLGAWFLKNMEALPLDRAQPDPRTVRQVVKKLKAGKVVGIFPEAGIRIDETSALNGGGIKPGVGQIARLSKVPVVPCVILESKVFLKAASWLPFNRVIYGISYGRPIYVDRNLSAKDAAMEVEEKLLDEWKVLHRELIESWPR